MVKKNTSEMGLSYDKILNTIKIEGIEKIVYSVLDKNKYIIKDIRKTGDGLDITGTSATICEINDQGKIVAEVGEIVFDHLKVEITGELENKSDDISFAYRKVLSKQYPPIEQWLTNSSKIIVSKVNKQVEQVMAELIEQETKFLYENGYVKYDDPILNLAGEESGSRVRYATLFDKFEHEQHGRKLLPIENPWDNPDRKVYAGEVYWTFLDLAYGEEIGGIKRPCLVTSVNGRKVKIMPLSSKVDYPKNQQYHIEISKKDYPELKKGGVICTEMHNDVDMGRLFNKICVLSQEDTQRAIDLARKREDENRVWVVPVIKTNEDPETNIIAKPKRGRPPKKKEEDVVEIVTPEEKINKNDRVDYISLAQEKFLITDEIASQIALRRRYIWNEKSRSNVNFLFYNEEIEDDNRDPNFPGKNVAYNRGHSNPKAHTFETEIKIRAYRGESRKGDKSSSSNDYDLIRCIAEVMSEQYGDDYKRAYYYNYLDFFKHRYLEHGQLEKFAENFATVLSFIGKTSPYLEDAITAPFDVLNFEALKDTGIKPVMPVQEIRYGRQKANPTENEK